MADEQMADGEREAERRIEKVRREGGRLDLSGLRLKTVPESIRKLDGVNTLDLSGNDLAVLPDWFGLLPELNFLNLMHNPIPELPSALVKASGLGGLLLSGTRLVSLPN